MDETQPVLDLSGDPILRAFAQWAQENGLSLSLTLSVRGIVLSGQLVSRDEWLEELSRSLSHTGETGRQLGHTLEEIFRTVDLEQESDADVTYQYIHLKHVQVIIDQQNAVPLGGPPLWRGRISEVSGWSLGRIAS